MNENDFKEYEKEKSRVKSLIFGKRFAGAILSDSLLPEKEMLQLKAWIDKPTDFLIMMGSPGVGKTFHCAAMYDWWFDKRREISYVNENTFFMDIRLVFSS